MINKYEGISPNELRHHLFVYISVMTDYNNRETGISFLSLDIYCKMVENMKLAENDVAKN